MCGWDVGSSACITEKMNYALGVTLGLFSMLSRVGSQLWTCQRYTLKKRTQSWSKSVATIISNSHSTETRFARNVASATWRMLRRWAVDVSAFAMFYLFDTLQSLHLSLSCWMSQASELFSVQYVMSVRFSWCGNKKTIPCGWVCVRVWLCVCVGLLWFNDGDD